MSIVNDCMVVNLQIGVWTGHRFDKDATRRAIYNENASEDAARVNKHLVSKDALAKITTSVGLLRQHFYFKTLPWKDNGDRLLTRKMYMDFIKDHARLKDEFFAEVDHFLHVNYPRARDNARLRLGDMFREGDYPEVEVLRQRFYVTLDIDAVTTANDFRVSLDADQIDLMRKDMERAVHLRIHRAVAHIYTRLITMLNHVHEKMSDANAAFKSSTIDNLRELAETLPQLNITNDPQLEEYGQKIMAAIQGVDAPTLRRNKTVRAEVADEVKKIMDDMSGFMTAFGATQ